MKNLKKVLALVLAFACAFTMFAGAAFTDQADIAVDSDAVDTLVALGVIDGYEDGSFQPEVTVTRAEMAKMIYVLRTGNSDASAYNDDATSFTDITSHWARGYIKYCQSMGIIAGKSTTSFDPDADVTTQEAAKMLLVTLGYDAERAGLEGSGWGQKTTALADENGLLEDVFNGTTQGLQRQYAAQMMYNAIDAPTVVYRDGAYTTNNYGNGDNPTIGEKYMGLHSVEGILSSFQKEDGKDTYMATVTNITKQDGSTKVTLAGQKEDFTKIATDFYSLKNQKVRVLYKETDEVYGVFALSDSNTVLTGVLGDFGKDGDKLKFDGTKYTVGDTGADATNWVKVDGSDASSNENNIVAYVDAVNGLAKAFNATAISNSDNSKINLLDIHSFAVGQVTYVGSDYINVSYKDGSNTQSLPSKLEADDATYPSDIEKNDYVAVTPSKNTSDGNIGVTKLDMVEGKITATKNASGADNYQITIDGTSYEKAGATTDVAQLTLNATVSIVVKDGYFLYVDNANAGAKDIALMTELYKSGNRWYATLLKDDGSLETVTLKKNEGYNGSNPTDSDDFDGSTTTDAAKCALVSYTKSGDEYKLTVLGARETAGYDVYDTGSNDSVKNNQLQTNSVKAIDENAVVFVRYQTDKFTVITGEALRGWSDNSTFASAVLANASNGVNYAQVVYANLGAENIKGGSGVNYGYVFDASTGTNADEDTFNVYHIWNGSETIEVWTEDTDSIARGNVIKYSIDGEVEGNTEISIDKVYSGNGTTGVVLNGDYNSDLNGTAYFAATNYEKINKDAAAAIQNSITFDSDDDSIILFVDTSADDATGTGIASDSVTNLRDFVREEGNDYVTNATYWTDGSAKIMVIDIDSELDSGLSLTTGTDTVSVDSVKVAQAKAALEEVNEEGITATAIDTLSGSDHDQVVAARGVFTDENVTYSVEYKSGVTGTPTAALTDDGKGIKVTEDGTNDINADDEIVVEVTIKAGSASDTVNVTLTVADHA